MPLNNGPRGRPTLNSFKILCKKKRLLFLVASFKTNRILILIFPTNQDLIVKLYLTKNQMQYYSVSTALFTLSYREA